MIGYNEIDVIKPDYQMIFSIVIPITVYIEFGQHLLGSLFRKTCEILIARNIQTTVEFLIAYICHSWAVLTKNRTSTHGPRATPYEFCIPVRVP